MQPPKHADPRAPASHRPTVRLEEDGCWRPVAFHKLREGDIAYQEEDGELWTYHDRYWTFQVESGPFRVVNYQVVYATGIPNSLLD